jgi:hypothetical protein
MRNQFHLESMSGKEDALDVGVREPRGHRQIERVGNISAVGDGWIAEEFPAHGDVMAFENERAVTGNASIAAAPPAVAGRRSLCDGSLDESAGDRTHR